MEILPKKNWDVNQQKLDFGGKQMELKPAENWG